MDTGNNSTALTLTLLLGILLQVLFVFADSAESPNKTAVAFSKAYFKLDPAMGTYLCSDLAEADEADVVGQFLQRATREAQQRGFALHYLKSNLYHITTQTLSKSQDKATIRIVCKRRKSINPVFAIVAKIFFIGNTYSVDEVIELVKEKGKWKVCGAPYALT